MQMQMIYDITPTPAAESPICQSLDDFTVCAIAYDVWMKMIESIGVHTRNEGRPLVDCMRDYIPLVICEMMKMAEERGMV